MIIALQNKEMAKRVGVRLWFQLSLEMRKLGRFEHFGMDI